MRIFQGIIALVLFWINSWKQSIDIDNMGFFSTILYKNILFPNRQCIIIFIYCLVIVVELINQLRVGYKARKIISGVLDHIIKSRFNGEFDNNRITVFKISSGWGCILKLLWKKCAFNFITEPKRIKQKIIFPNPFRKYLWISSRVGQPSEDGSITHFLVPRNKNEFEGVCSKAVYTKKPVFVTLPELNRTEFESAKCIDDLPNQAIKDKVKNYMKLSHISDFDMLKSINRTSMEIWASPIFKGKNIWGVLVFDQEQVGKSYKNIDAELLYDSKILDILIG
jgi:hypothetical protein